MGRPGGTLLKPLEEVGPRTREKLLEAFGTEEELVRAARDMELDRFVAVRGISHRKAVEIISTVVGVDTFAFLKTEAGQSIYEDILQRIQAHAQTSYARNKVLLLKPLSELKSREALLERVMAAKDMARQLPRERLGSLLSRLPPLKRSRPVFDSSKVVVVEDKELLRRLEPYNRYCEILLPQDLDRPEEYDLILYVCTSGTADIEGLDQVHVVFGNPEPWQLFPESVIDFFRTNEGVLQVLKDLCTDVDGLHVAEEVLELISGVRLEAPVVKEDALEDVIRRTNEELKEKLSRLSLEGHEVLELLQKGLPRRLQEVFAEVLEEGEQDILRRSGLNIRLEPTYPLKLPEEEVERALRTIRQKSKMRGFEAMKQVARLLISRQEDVRSAYRRALEFDFEMAMGSFALEYDLQRPRWGIGLKIRGALHLSLVGLPDAQRVDYTLSPPERVAILTGANSGGKTTLLETLAQVYILATLGLPVNAREALLEPLEACYFFSQQRSLTAGALEGFLTTFVPLALDGSRKIILADELEAMTEPEAAGAIIASFLELIKNGRSYAVAVTHAARSILRLTSVRVDGIEAQGLDEDYNLIVDRKPKPNVIARSTPELILQRLQALKGGDESDLYGRILQKLHDAR